MLKSLPTLGLLFSLVSWGQKPTALIYTANRQGEIEPCGCQTNQVGGLNRMAEYLNGLKKENEVLLVDSGDSFFSAPKVRADRASQELLRAQLIADSYKEMGLNYISPGDRDLALGAKTFFELVSRCGAKVVSANLKSKDQRNLISSYELWQKSDIRVFVTGVVPVTTSKVEGLEVEPVEESLEKVISTARGYQPDYILVLSHLGQSEDERIAKKFAGVFILGSHSMDSLSEPLKLENSYVFQPGIEGQHIGEVPLEKGGGLKAHALRDLGKSLDRNNPVKLLMKKYYEQLKSLPSQGMSNKNAATHFVGNPLICKKCHEEQYQFWRETKHSSAILVLYAKNRHQDPQCIGCHTLGYGTQEGFSSLSEAIQVEKPNKKSQGKLVEDLLKKTFTGDDAGDLDSRTDPQRHRRLHNSYWDNIHQMARNQQIKKLLLGVQCEHCHENRKAHVISGARGAAEVKTESCKVCHRPPNAPDFNPAVLNQVACPRMVKAPREKE
jgi:hypothetical protein